LSIIFIALIFHLFQVALPYLTLQSFHFLLLVVTIIIIMIIVIIIDLIDLIIRASFPLPFLPPFTNDTTLDVSLDR
jgi:hypothetical protein